MIRCLAAEELPPNAKKSIRGQMQFAAYSTNFLEKALRHNNFDARWPWTRTNTDSRSFPEGELIRDETRKIIAWCRLASPRYRSAGLHFFHATESRGKA